MQSNILTLILLILNSYLLLGTQKGFRTYQLHPEFFLLYQQDIGPISKIDFYTQPLLYFIVGNDNLPKASKKVQSVKDKVNSEIVKFSKNKYTPCSYSESKTQLKLQSNILYLFNAKTQQVQFKLKFKAKINRFENNKQLLVVSINSTTNSIVLVDLIQKDILTYLDLNQANVLGRFKLTQNHEFNKQQFLMFTDSIREGTLKLYSVSDKQIQQTIKAHESPIMYIEVANMRKNQNYQIFATTSCKQEYIKVWQIKDIQNSDYKIHAYVQIETTSVLVSLKSLRFSTQNQFLICFQDEKIKFYNLPELQDLNISESKNDEQIDKSESKIDKYKQSPLTFIKDIFSFKKINEKFKTLKQSVKNLNIKQVEVDSAIMYQFNDKSKELQVYSDSNNYYSIKNILF